MSTYLIVYNKGGAGRDKIYLEWHFNIKNN